MLQEVFCWTLAEVVSETCLCTWTGFKQTVAGTEDDTPVTSWMQTSKYRDGLRDNIMSRRRSEIYVWRPHIFTLDDCPVKLALHTSLDGFQIALNYTAVLLWTKEQINLSLLKSTEVMYVPSGLYCGYYDCWLLVYFRFLKNACLQWENKQYKAWGTTNQGWMYNVKGMTKKI